MVGLLLLKFELSTVKLLFKEEYNSPIFHRLFFGWHMNFFFGTTPDKMLIVTFFFLLLFVPYRLRRVKNKHERVGRVLLLWLYVGIKCVENYIARCVCVYLSATVRNCRHLENNHRKTGAAHSGWSIYLSQMVPCALPCPKKKIPSLLYLYRGACEPGGVTAHTWIQIVIFS